MRIAPTMVSYPCNKDSLIRNFVEKDASLCASQTLFAFFFFLSYVEGQRTAIIDRIKTKQV